MRFRRSIAELTAKHKKLNVSDEWMKSDLLAFNKKWKEEVSSFSGGGAEWGINPKIKWDESDVRDNMLGFLDDLRAEFKNDAKGLAEATDLFGLDAYFGKAKLASMNFMDQWKDRLHGKGKDDVPKDELAPFRARIDNLNDLAGGPIKVFDDGLKELTVILGAIDKADPLNKLVDGAKNLMGVFGQGIDASGIKGMRAGGSPLDEGAAELAAYREYEKLKSSLGDRTPKFAGAVEAGSQQAYSTVAQFQAQNQTVDVGQEMRLMRDEAKQRDAERISLGRDILNAIRDDKSKVVKF